MAKKNKREAVGFDAQLNKSEAWIESHIKQLGIGLLVVCVIVIGIWLWNNHTESVEQDAAKAIAKSEMAFMQEQYQQALDGDGAAEKGLLKVIKEFSGTKTANLARLYAGLCYIHLDKNDDAIKMLESFDPQDDLMISPSAVAALGNCYVDKGDTEKGAETLVKAAKMADNEATSPVFLSSAAKLYESLGNTGKALELYQQIKKDYSTSMVANDIDKYIERVSK